MAGNAGTEFWFWSTATFYHHLPPKATLCPTSWQDVRTDSGQKVSENITYITSVRTVKAKYDSELLNSVGKGSVVRHSLKWRVIYMQHIRPNLSEEFP